MNLIKFLFNLIKDWFSKPISPIPEPIEYVEPTPEPVHVSRIKDWARGIEAYENTAKWRNNPGAIRSKSGPFLEFDFYIDGFNYLVDYLTRAATGKHAAYNPEMTLYQFQCVYSPKEDGNDPLKYATTIAKTLGITIDTQIKTLL